MRLIVDSDTGMVLSVLEDGSRIVKGKSIDAYAQFENIPNGETFTKLYHGIINELADCDLTSNELIIFLFLASNLRYQSNVSKYRNGKIITRDNVVADLKISDITLRRSIPKLVKQGLIVEASTTEGKCFIVNPYVVMVGDKINKTIFDLFRKSRWARW